MPDEKESKKRSDRDRSAERPKKSSRQDESKPATTSKEEAKEELPADVKDFSKWELEPEEFIVTVNLEGKTILGLDVHWDDGRTLYIKGIKDGVVKSWNSEKPGEEVKPGDKVLAVNGVADDPKAMLGECRNRGKLNLLIRGQYDRSQLKVKAKGSAPLDSGDESLVSIDTQGQPLGLDIDWADGKSLYIKGVNSPGAIESWNKSQSAEQAVIPGCTVVAVNGVSGDPAAMVNQCRTHRRLQLLVRVPPLPPATDSKNARSDKENGNTSNKNDKDRNR